MHDIPLIIANIWPSIQTRQKKALWTKILMYFETYW